MRRIVMLVLFLVAAALLSASVIAQEQPAAADQSAEAAPVQADVPASAPDSQVNTDPDFPPVDVSKPLTVEQALDIAFRQSPTIRAAIAQLEVGRAGVRQARANFNPKFNLDVQQQFQGPQVSFPNPFGEGIVNLVREENTVGFVAFSLPIDASKQLAYTGDIAKYQYQIDYLSLLTTAEQLIFQVKTDYYTLLRAIGQQGTAQAAVDVAVQRLKDATAKFEAGTAPKFDVTRTEVEVANLNQVLLAQINRVGIARAQLNRTIGIDPTLPTQVVDVQTQIVDPSNLDTRTFVDSAFTNRPEVAIAQTSIFLNQRNVRLQRTAILPKVELTSGLTYNLRTSGFASNNASWQALLDVRVPIWDGGVTKAKVDAANAQVDAAIEQLESEKLRVGFEVQAAILNLKEAAERTKTTQQAVDLAEETLRLATVRYDAGIAVLVEVTDAESALTNARFNYVQAKYDYDLAIAQLQRASATQPEIAKLELCGARVVY